MARVADTASATEKGGQAYVECCSEPSADAVGPPERCRYPAVTGAVAVADWRRCRVRVACPLVPWLLQSPDRLRDCAFWTLSRDGKGAHRGRICLEGSCFVFVDV